MASTTPSIATAVDFPACRQQLRSTRSCPPSSTSSCHGSGCKPRFVMTSAADGLGRLGRTTFSFIGDPFLLLLLLLLLLLIFFSLHSYFLLAAPRHFVYPFTRRCDFTIPFSEPTYAPPSQDLLRS